MTRIARTIAATPLSLVIAMTSLAGSAAAQTQLFEVERSDATKLLQVQDDAGFVVKGSQGVGTIPASGRGVRLLWYPNKSAFRAGRVELSEWDDSNIGDASVAFGWQTLASGVYAAAIGQATKATANSSTALGAETLASGEFSTAIGAGTTAEGARSTAMGTGTIARGRASTAMGSITTATGDASTAMGANTVASGALSTAMGDRSAATGTGSTAMGAATVASGALSTAMGDRSAATGTGSTAMGAATVASGNYATAMGVHTTGSGDFSTAMGRYAEARGKGTFVYGDNSSDAIFASDVDNQFLVRAHGGIGFNSGTNIGCDLPAGTGAWACTSSRLAKEGFEDVDGEAVLARLAGIRIQSWRYLGTPAVHVGPTAEDFRAAFGLGEGSTKIATVDADGIALRAVQALEARTTALRAENATLRAGNAELLRRLEALEAERTPAAR